MIHYTIYLNKNTLLVINGIMLDMSLNATVYS